MITVFFKKRYLNNERECGNGDGGKKGTHQSQCREKKNRGVNKGGKPAHKKTSAGNLSLHTFLSSHQKK